jgi:hypothetical protein
MILVMSLEVYSPGNMVSENKINKSPPKETSRRRKSASTTISRMDLADLLVLFFMFLSPPFVL